MRTLLISLEMENSSTHAMRAAEARDTVCGARLEGSTRPEHAENSERDISLRDVGVPQRLDSPSFRGVMKRDRHDEFERRGSV